MGGYSGGPCRKQVRKRGPSHRCFCPYLMGDGESDRLLVPCFSWGLQGVAAWDSGLSSRGVTAPCPLPHDTPTLAWGAPVLGSGYMGCRVEPEKVAVGLVPTIQHLLSASEGHLGGLSKEWVLEGGDCPPPLLP